MTSEDWLMFVFVMIFGVGALVYFLFIPLFGITIATFNTLKDKIKKTKK